MELEDLKSTWKSVRPHIGNGLQMDSDCDLIRRKADVKTRLFRRYLVSLMLTLVGGLGTVTSRLWAPVQLPASWIVAFGIFCLMCAVLELYLLLKIRRIDLWNYSVKEILNSTIQLRRIYKSAELIMTLAITIMFVWMSFLPPFAGNWRVSLIWIFFAASLVVEFKFYKKNIKLLDRLSANINDNN